MSHDDWHSADIIAALKKQGMTLANESRKAGYTSSTLVNTLESRVTPALFHVEFN